MNPYQYNKMREYFFDLKQSLARFEQNEGVTLRRNANGCFVPNTEGVWDWTQKDRKTPITIHVRLFKNDFVFSVPSEEFRERSVKEISGGSFEYVSPLLETYTHMIM